MTHVHGNCCSIFNFSSPFTSISTKHHLSSISQPSFLSPHPLHSISLNRNFAFQASIDDQTNNGPLISASDVVRNFYDGINRHHLPSVEPLIAPNCVYEDLIFPTPFVGRKSILEFFGKFIDYVSTDLQFVIDAISEEDSLAVGVIWHLEWKGRPFPFSKGCSFYQLAVVDDMRQIIYQELLIDDRVCDFKGKHPKEWWCKDYARDSVEPAIKPGESALIAIRGVVWLLQRFPNLAERL